MVLVRVWLGGELYESQSEAPMAQLVERQSHNLKVASSILAGSNSFALTTSFLSTSKFTLLTRSSHPTPSRIQIPSTRTPIQI